MWIFSKVKAAGGLFWWNLDGSLSFSTVFFLGGGPIY